MCARTDPSPVDHVIGINPAQLAQDQGRRAEAGEDRLDQVETDEGAQEQPPRIDEVGEGDAEQRDGTGEEAD